MDDANNGGDGRREKGQVDYASGGTCSSPDQGSGPNEATYKLKRPPDAACLTLTLAGQAYFQEVLGILDSSGLGKQVWLPIVENDSDCGSQVKPASEVHSRLPESDASASRSNDGRTILLSGAIDVCTVNVDVQCLRLMDMTAASAIEDILKPWNNFRLATEMSWNDVHDHTKAAMAICDSDTFCETPRCVHLYTDGSAKDGRSGWATVVLQSSVHQPRVALLGYFGGSVITDDDDAAFLGAQQMEARDAELTAIGWAVLWILGHWELLCLGKAV